MTTTTIARGDARPFMGVPALVMLVAAAHLLLWGGSFALTRQVPALDSSEQLVWSYALELGYWKHPPLPTWLMHGLVSVFGRSIALPVLASEACVAVAMVLTWRFGCALLSPRASLVAMALTSLVMHHNLGAEPFNHNTVLLPFQAATTLFFFLALRGQAWRHWVLAGLFAGLAMLVKYVALFPLAALGIYLLLDRKTWTRATLRGLLLMVAIALLVWAPHARWLYANDFQPLHYAQHTTLHEPDAVSWIEGFAGFLWEQAWSLVPLVAVLFWTLRQPAREAAPFAPDLQRDRLFLWVAGTAPLALMALYSLMTGTHLFGRWGSTQFLLAGWLALDLLRRRGVPALAPTLRNAGIAHLLLCVAVTLVGPIAARKLDLHGRGRFPGDALAAEAERTWQAHVDAPLRLVVSDLWIGGNLAARRTEPLAVLLDGSFRQSPWIRRGDLAGCGALVLFNRTEFGRAPQPALLRRLERATVRGSWKLPWIDSSPNGTDGVDIEWGIIPPVPGRSCRL